MDVADGRVAAEIRIERKKGGRGREKDRKDGGHDVV